MSIGLYLKIGAMAAIVLAVGGHLYLDHYEDWYYRNSPDISETEVAKEISETPDPEHEAEMRAYEAWRRSHVAPRDMRAKLLNYALVAAALYVIGGIALTMRQHPTA